MKIELDNLTDWFCANKLSLNVIKTNYMIFTNANIEQINMKFTITNTTTTQTKYGKFLGVLIDEELKWDEHIKIAKQKINRSFFAINQTEHILQRKHIITLYYSLVYPYLTYKITL